MFVRPIYHSILSRLKEERKFIQVLGGARQVGKTTLIHQVLKKIAIKSSYVSCDSVPLNSIIWIEQQWEAARIKMKLEKCNEFILVFDEIQKIGQWTDIVKKLWDKDSRDGIQLKVVILGSSQLLIQQGLTESLAGRFELTTINHWSYQEMHNAFGLSVEEFIYFGGYPGAASFINDESRWKNYITDALIETTISKDILMMKRIDKPALLKNLFLVGCQYSGQILSYNKLLGQLQNAGNTTTLAHYLNLLSSAKMIAGLTKYASQNVRKKSSSPKFQVFNTALISAQSEQSFDEIKASPSSWGRIVESSIGAHLINFSFSEKFSLYYWRDKGNEVDFILQKGEKLIAIEVKSGSKKENMPGLITFSENFKNVKSLLVGEQGIKIENFLSINPIDLF